MYATFVESSVRSYPLHHPTARLSCIQFTYHGKSLTAEVGRELAGFPEAVGDVLAIVETIAVLFVHTVARGALSATPISVGPKQVTRRQYFDDFSPRP